MYDYTELMVFVFLISYLLVASYIFIKSELFWVEIILSLFTLMMLMGMVVSFIPPFLQHAKVSELFTLVTGIRTQLVEYYSYHGKWPVQAEFEQMGLKTTGKYTEHIRLQQGVLSGTLKDTGFILTFRPVTAATQTKVVFWVCGDAEPPEGLMASGENLTTLPPASLPHGCRK